MACAVWVVAVERQWQQRVGPFARFFLQLDLWVGAALVAIWISDQARVGPKDREHGEELEGTENEDWRE